MRKRNANEKMRIRLFISLGVVAEVGSRAIASIASESPKIRSARVSIRGRGRRGPPASAGVECSRTEAGGEPNVAPEGGGSYFIFIPASGAPSLWEDQARSCVPPIAILAVVQIFRTKESTREVRIAVA